MGVLRSDLITHSSLEPTGSVLLDGNSDYLSWSDTSIKLGTSDFTLEAWINITSDTTAHQTIFMAGDSSDAGEMVFQMITADSGSAIGSGAGRELGVRVAGTGYYSGFRIVFGEWTHVACVRDGGTLTFFVDGVQGMSHAVAENLTTAFTQIGYRDGSYNGYFNGYISNARIALGALYKNSFTPSKFELENVPGTLLLCCQSSTSATTAAVKPAAVEPLPEVYKPRGATLTQNFSISLFAVPGSPTKNMLISPLILLPSSNSRCVEPAINNKMDSLIIS